MSLVCMIGQCSIVPEKVGVALEGTRQVCASLLSTARDQLNAWFSICTRRQKCCSDNWNSTTLHPNYSIAQACRAARNQLNSLGSICMHRQSIALTS